MTLVFRALYQLGLIGALALTFWSLANPTYAMQYSVLHAFSGPDGIAPLANVIIDASSNIYGTTPGGGDGKGCHHRGCGTVFKLAPDGYETVLHTFTGKTHGDGSEPLSGLLIDKAGYLYGTTVNGGHGCLKDTHTSGCGTVFEIAPDGMEKVLHAFQRPSKGIFPYSSLVADKNGKFYGVTNSGGNNGCNKYGCGVIFNILENGKEKVLHVFDEDTDGGLPVSGPIIDEKGNLFGTAEEGGPGCFYCGTVYELTPDGTFILLHSFTGGSGGATPAGGLAKDDAGNLFGATVNGGTNGCGGYGCGTVFKIASDGTYSVLHAFAGGTDGAQPFAGVIVDNMGNLYGTARTGGNSGCDGGCGIVFKIAPDGTETILHVFTDGDDGATPMASLVSDEAGNLYGTTTAGGNGCLGGCGTVFELKN